MDVTIHEVTWYVIKQKQMMQQNSCTTQHKFLPILRTL
jgi:hypothetical protein